MLPLGTLFNAFMVIVGSLLGLFFKRLITPELNKKVFVVMGLFTLILGFSMAIKSTNFIIMLLSIVIGTILGEKYDFYGSLTHYIDVFKTKSHIKESMFTDGLVTSFLLFCVGSMTIVGAIDEGLGNTPSILYTKGLMDGISSVVLASTFGVGVLFSVIPLFFFQTTITLLVFYFKDVLSLELIDHISSVGGVLIIVIGLKLLGYEKIKAVNMLPSLLMIPLIYYISNILTI